MRERLLRILDLTDNASYSHAARMVSISKECKEGLAEIKAKEDAEVDLHRQAARPAEPTTSKPDEHVGKAREPLQKPHPAPAGKVTL